MTSSSSGSRRLISIVTGSLNEEDNARLFYEKLCSVAASLPAYDFEFVWIDNHSQDRTVEVLKELAASDPRLHLIVNTRNFGSLRSGFHAMMQATGDAVVVLASDFQDPPDMIAEFVSKWEAGYKVVLGQKLASDESKLVFLARSAYYKTLRRLSEVELLEGVTGWGLYDRVAIEGLRLTDEPYPYLRGLICDLGYRRALVEYTQPSRKRGLSKHNFYALYDIAMVGLTSHSKVPLRLATTLGFLASALSLFIALGYLVAKLVFWNQFTLGTAPLVVGLFLFASVQLFFTGVLGEYVGAVHARVTKRPLVVEEERINFAPPRRSRSNEETA